MKNNKLFALFLSMFSIVILLISTTYATSYGKVNFSISCKPNVQNSFNNAIALIHNMMYMQAEKKFENIIKQDPNCAMAYWGIALSQIHPLWSDVPTNEDYIKGAKALKKASSFKNLTPKESAFINALSPIYYNWKTEPYKERIAKWELKQKELYEKYPNDPEAISLYALTHLATAKKGDKTLSHQLKAGKLLEQMHNQHPMHPAGYHYTIHAYDHPNLAHKAESQAKGYDKIAPSVPHALHMPTHIFVRLGQWPETIKWNIRSAEAAKKQYLKGGAMSMHYVHALDYLMYAYLQQGETKKAKNVLKQLNSISKFEPTFPTAYGIAATRARYYLEQHLWKQAATMQVNIPNNFPWNKFPAAEAISYFAQGLGAIKSGNLKLGEKNIKKLDSLYNELNKSNSSYWATLTNAKQKTLQAWLEFEKGNKKLALLTMKMAADLEDSVDKHPVTPGEVLPARELYADMLMQTNQTGAALNAYQEVLKISPNRYNSIYGASIAAKQSGQKTLAATYYKRLKNQIKTTE